jgi:hypothetical protein
MLFRFAFRLEFSLAYVGAKADGNRAVLVQLGQKMTASRPQHGAQIAIAASLLSLT